MTTERTPTLAGYEPSSANALKPGPLDAGMEKMLTAGRSVLLRENGLCTFNHGSGEALSVTVIPGDYEAHVFLSEVQYVGERGDDGWITAPPGGWSENPVPGRVVEWKNAARDSDVYLSDDVCGLGKPLGGNVRIIAFRLVEEAGGGDQGSSAQEADTHRATEGAVVGLSDPMREALESARAALREASCWRTTEHWSAERFREFVRAENLRQCTFSLSERR